MKIKRLLSAVLCLAMVVGLVPAMSLTASAADTYCVGKKYSAPTYEVTTDYGPSTWSFKVSDPEMVEFSADKKRMKFLKPGNVTITTEWYRTDVIGGRTLKPVYGSFINMYEVVMPTAKSIGPTDIQVASSEFVGGGIFPTFKVDDNSLFDVSKAHFSYKMIDYSQGDRLPIITADGSMYVRLVIDPIYGYYFDREKTYTITYNGKAHDAYVVELKDELGMPRNYLTTYVNVIFITGVIYNPQISGLDVPAHNTALDKTAESGDHCTVTKVSYYDYPDGTAELDKVIYGKTARIRVYVQADSRNNFEEGGKAYWADAKLYSEPGVKVDSKNGYYDFLYEVDATPGQIIKSVEISVHPPITGGIQHNDVYIATPGIVAAGDAEWTFWMTGMEGMPCEVKVAFKKDALDTYYILDPALADNGAVSINGVKADKVYTDKSNPGVYYAEATIETANYASQVQMSPTEAIVKNYFTNQVLNRPAAVNMVAFYNGSGCLVGVEKSQISGSDSANNFAIPKEAEYCSVMMWQKDGLMQPMAKSTLERVPVVPITAVVDMDVSIDDGAIGEVKAYANGGKGAYSYRWQYQYFDDEKLSFTQWDDILFAGDLGKVFVDGENKDTLKIKASIDTITNKSLRIRCIVSDAYGNVTETESGIIRLNTQLLYAHLETNCLNVIKGAEKSTLRAIAAYGPGGGYTYEWQFYSNAENRWTPISELAEYEEMFDGIDTDTLTIKEYATSTTSSIVNGMRIRCRVRSTDSVRYDTEECVVNVLGSGFLAEMLQSSYKLTDGGFGLFVVATNGGEKPYSYQWKFNTDGSDVYKDVQDYPELFPKSTNNNYLAVIADTESYPNGIYITCVVTDKNGNTGYANKTLYMKFE